MCELLGMSFNLPVRPNISFKGFRKKGEYNPDGWGIAFYPDVSAQVIKEPLKATESCLSKFLKGYKMMESKIFIAHVRRSSSTKVSHSNTHPFNRELFGKEYIFAHNGTLEGYEDLNLERFNPIGETDSEYIFCYLLDCIRKENIIHWERRNFDWLFEKLKSINEYGTFNCIFSDGEYLFCYHDKEGYNGLFFLHRKSPYGNITLLDEDCEVNLSEEKREEQTGYIIATKKLTNEDWEEFKCGELIVFKDGMMVYSSRRCTGRY